MGIYTLWCLNRVATWDLEALARVLAGRGLFSSRHRVVLGDRSEFDRDAEDSKLGVLSHEEHEVDEYFVPIAVKCIGDPERFAVRFQDRMGARGRERFTALLAAFRDYFSQTGKNPWRQYWKPSGREVMFTRVDGEAPHAGFYEIVARQAEREGPAVLVGYSQGGLVARFIAFLDEYLMERRSVAAFVTVQAPNRGSPLANSGHAKVAAYGLFGLLSGAASFPIPPVGLNTHLGGDLEALANQCLRFPLASGDTGLAAFDITAVARLLDVAMQDAQQAIERETPGTRAYRVVRDRLDLVTTARKWLSGLSGGVVATAFQDLDTRSQDDPESVLGVVADHPIGETYHGAVVGTDNGLSDFVSSGHPWWIRWPLKCLLNHFEFERKMRNSEQSYSRIVMNELESIPRNSGGNTSRGRHAALAEAFSAGCSIWGPDRRRVRLEPFAHDFVIPSASQALGALGRPDQNPEDRPTQWFLGNLVNPGGTHISGGDASDPDCDRPHVESMLAAIGRRLR